MQKNELKQQNINLPKQGEIKTKLESFTQKLVNGVKVLPETQIAVTKNWVRLGEMRVKNDFMYSKIFESSNTNTTLFTIINNSSVGLELGTDFYFVYYSDKKGGKIGTITTGKGYKLLAEKFSIKPVDYIKVFVLTKQDSYKLIWNMDNDMFELHNYELSLNANIQYEDIEAVYGVVKFKDGAKRSRIIRKDELDKMKKSSPSANNKDHPELEKYSPWNVWPERMVESKMYRDIIKREIDLDTNKMAQNGYKMIDDDTPIEVSEIKDENEKEIIVINQDGKVFASKQNLLEETTIEIENENELVINRAKDLLDKKGIEDISLLSDTELNYVLNGEKND